MLLMFADPHAPWQRGTNENTNGLIRDFFLKGTNFCECIEKDIKHVERLLNSRPRKVLGFQTPQEVFDNALRNYS
jgi:transposase, IS30 family